MTAKTGSSFSIFSKNVKINELYRFTGIDLLLDIQYAGNRALKKYTPFVMGKAFPQGFQRVFSHQFLKAGSPSSWRNGNCGIGRCAADFKTVPQMALAYRLDAISQDPKNSRFPGPPFSRPRTPFSRPLVHPSPARTTSPSAAVRKSKVLIIFDVYNTCIWMCS